jgi:hypothetical protein
MPILRKTVRRIEGVERSERAEVEKQVEKAHLMRETSDENV